MIIRSQDKLRIETFNNAEVGHSCNSVYVNGLPFGVYSTEEKAIKVLDMIEDAHRSMSFTDGVVFRMPQDSEV